MFRNPTKLFSNTLLALFAMAVVAPVWAQSESAQLPPGHAPELHRYLVKRNFPRGALAGLDQATKDKVNATNAKFRVTWIKSFANADKTLTYCVYEGPNEQAIRDAAAANGLPVAEVIPVPVTLNPHGHDTGKH